MNNNFLLEYELCAQRGDISPEAITEIKNHLRHFNDPVYAEIGVCFGGTFSQIVDFLSSNFEISHSYGFDLYEDLPSQPFGESQTHETTNKWGILNVPHKKVLENKLKEMGFSNFKLIKGDSSLTVPLLERGIDVALIDGNHTYKQTLIDFQSVFSKCKSGSIIIFDNATNNMEPDPRYVALDGGPYKVCEELKQREDLKFLKQINHCKFFKVL